MSPQRLKWHTDKLFNRFRKSTISSPCSVVSVLSLSCPLKRMCARRLLSFSINEVVSPPSSLVSMHGFPEGSEPSSSPTSQKLPSSFLSPPYVTYWAFLAKVTMCFSLPMTSCMMFPKSSLKFFGSCVIHTDGEKISTAPTSNQNYV